jgi:hypothetical protein
MQAPDTTTEAARWTAWDDVGLDGGGNPGTFLDVGCAAVTNPATDIEELHVCAVTQDGHLWHTFGPAKPPYIGLSYAPFVDVEGLAGEVGDFTRVACTGLGSRLFLVGVTREGGAWFSIQQQTRWRPFEDVKAAISAPFSDLGVMADVAIGFCNAGVAADPSRDVAQLNVVLLEEHGPNSGGRFKRVIYSVFTSSPQSWSLGRPPSLWMPRGEIATATPLQPGDENDYRGISLAERPFLP